MLKPTRSCLISNVTTALLAILSYSGVLSSTARAFTYSLDDGTANSALGGLGVSQPFIMLNQFPVVGGSNVINAISVAWGTPGVPNNPTLNGIPYTVVLWSDPNGDGLPYDAVVLATAEATIAAAGTNTFITTMIPPTTVSTPGFFVGYRVAFQGDQSGVAYDSTPPTFSTRSFNKPDENINDLSGATDPGGQPINWMIRAAATPEPSLVQSAVNIDINGGTPMGPTYSGLGASPDAGTVWNGVDGGGPTRLGGVTNAPMLDSSGSSTPILFSKIQTIGQNRTSPPWTNNVLLDDYSTGNINYSLTGLPPGAGFDLYLFGTQTATGSGATFSLAAGNGGATGQTTGTTSMADRPPFVRGSEYVVLTGAANASGAIDGTANGAFNGLQLQLIPSFTVVSRKTHGAIGARDIVLPQGNERITECRSGGPERTLQLVLLFNAPATINGATVVGGEGAIAGHGGNGTPNITVFLSGVGNAQTVSVKVWGVTSANKTADVVIRVPVLLGDTTGNGVVNSSDVAETKSLVGQDLDDAGRADVTTSGDINSSDISLVKANSGSVLPATRQSPTP